MATTAILCELVTLNTRSSDLSPIIGGGSGNSKVATSATDGFIVTAPSGETFGNERLFFTMGSDGSGGTVTFKAGDRYPAQRADLGDLAITLAADDCRYIAIETSRFLQNDGTINVIPSTTGIALTAIMLPKAA